MTCKDTTVFEKLYEAFLNKFNEEQQFMTYFFNYYGSRKEKWVFCYRNKHLDVNTNMYLESFHNKLKTLYMNRKQNKRIDRLLEILLEIEKHYYIEYERKTMYIKPEVFGICAQKTVHPYGTLTYLPIYG
jgi:hypothetical protein